MTRGRGTDAHQAPARPPDTRVDAIEAALTPPVVVNRIVRLVPVGTPPTRPEPGERIMRLTLGSDPAHPKLN